MSALLFPVLVVLLGFQGAPRGLPPFLVSFEQQNLTFDGQVEPDSPWGTAVLDYVGFPQVTYFNLAVNGAWSIENVPILSHEGAGVRQRLRIDFDLRVPSGTDVRTVTFGYDLTDVPRRHPPRCSRLGWVFDHDVVLSSGLQGRCMEFCPLGDFVGAAVFGDKYVYEGFPNQDCGDYECVPAACSNSVQWLNKEFELGIPAADMSIETMKSVTGWDKDLKGTPDNWPEKKDEWMKAKGYPITTETFDRFDIGKIPELMKKKCDIELMINVHCVAVVGFQVLENGKYEIIVHSDSEQGKKVKGDRDPETLIYDPETSRFEGGSWCNGRFPEMLVAECVEKKK